MGCLLFHKWSDWTPVPGACEEVQKCAKCGDEKKRTVHQMSDWARVADNVCKKERHCTNPWCSVKEMGDMPHEWDGWDYYEDGCCTQRRTCKVCSTMEYREQCPKDKETIEVENECRVIKRCPRCGLEATESVEHAWGDVQSYQDCVTARKAADEKALKLMQANALMARLQRKDVDPAADAIKEYQLKARIEQDVQLLGVCGEGQNARMCVKCMTIQRVGKR